MPDLVGILVNTLFLYLVVLNFFLAFFIFFRNPKKNINQSFSLLCLLLSVWSFAVFASHSVAFNRYVWSRLSYFSQMIILLDVWYLSFIYPKKTAVMQTAAAIFGTAFLVVFSTLLIFTSFFVSKQNYFGNAFLLFSTLSWIPIAWTVLNLQQKFSQVLGLEKQQLKFIFYAYLLYAFNANFLANLFNISGNDYASTSFSALASLVLTIAVFYAIARYRLMDVRFIVSKIIVYTLLSLIVVLAYSMILFILGLYFYQAQLDGPTLLIVLSITLLTVLTSVPLKKALEKISNRAVLKDKLLRNQALLKFAPMFIKYEDLDSLAKHFCLRLRELLHLEGANLLYSRGDKIFFVPGDTKINFNKESCAVLFTAEKEFYIIDESPEGEIKNFMHDSKSYYMQIFKHKEFKAVLLLGYKLNGDIYFDDERNFLSVLLTQFFIALERVLLFEKTKNFNNVLQVKVRDATAEIGKSNYQLKQNLRLKDELISVVSHELIVPMVAISGSLSTIIEGMAGKVSVSAKDFLQAVYNENTRLIRLTKNLLSISRIRSGRISFEMEKFNPEKVIEEIAGLIQPLVEEKKLIFKLDIGSDNSRVYADKDKLKEVIINLLDNSIRYTKKGQIKLGLVEEGEKIKFYVQDSGSGISEKEKKHIFSDIDLLNDQKKLTKKGRGLGLYICHNLLAGMKGNIAVESLKAGTIFSFWLPKA